MLRHEELSSEVIGAAIEVHREIGPGSLESAYEVCLCRELSLRNIAFEKQVPLPIEYKGVKLDCGYRMDVLVDKTIVVEIKCVEELVPVHEAQLLTYLRLSQCPVGLLINFHVPILKHGIKRMAL